MLLFHKECIKFWTVITCFCALFHKHKESARPPTLLLQSNIVFIIVLKKLCYYSGNRIKPPLSVRVTHNSFRKNHSTGVNLKFLVLVTGVYKLSRRCMGYILREVSL